MAINPIKPVESQVVSPAPPASNEKGGEGSAMHQMLMRIIIAEETQHLMAMMRKEQKEFRKQEQKDK